MSSNLELQKWGMWNSDLCFYCFDIHLSSFKLRMNSVLNVHRRLTAFESNIYECPWGINMLKCKWRILQTHFRFLIQTLKWVKQMQFFWQNLRNSRLNWILVWEENVSCYKTRFFLDPKTSMFFVWEFKYYIIFLHLWSNHNAIFFCNSMYCTSVRSKKLANSKKTYVVK